MQKEMNSQNLQSNDLPQTGLIRLRQLRRFIPVSNSTWWAGVKSGRFPKPVHLSKRVTAWKNEDIHALIEGQTEWPD